MRNDTDVVLAAVTQYGAALHYAASGEIRNNKDIAMAAVMRNCLAFTDVGHSRQTDKDVIEAAVRLGIHCHVGDRRQSRGISAAAMKILLSDEMLMLGAACYPYMLVACEDSRVRTKRMILACITASVDAIKYVRNTDLTQRFEVELAQHFVNCCKSAGLGREACAAKAATCQSRDLCIRITSACYSELN
jgi:hypothetical protein